MTVVDTIHLSSDVHASRRFTGHPERHRRMAEVVNHYVQPDRPWRILEIGCGTGAALCQLGRALPQADCTGVDISEANIRLARARREDDIAGRIRYVADDYMRFGGGPFDLILADSVLHMIYGVSAEALFGKIAGELADGGLLIANTPYDCRYNQMLWQLRRRLQRVRTRFSDAAILTLARWIYGGRVDDDILRDCLPLMYMLPNYYDSDASRRRIGESCGLNLVAEHPAPHTSVAQPKHRIAVFQKRSP